MKPTRNISTLPKWAQKRISDLEAKIENMEQLMPWVATQNHWLMLYHPQRSNREKSFTLFELHENQANPVCSIGPKDFLFVGRVEE